MRRVVHHDVDEDRQEPTQDRRAITDLPSVHAAVPGRPAMQQLVAQNVEAIKQNGEDRRRVLLSDRYRDDFVACRQPLRPVFATRKAVLMAPERREDILG